MEVDDDGSNYTPLLERLTMLKNAVKPEKYSGRTRARAELLRAALAWVFECSKTHARLKKRGLAKAMYAEISGQAGLGVYKRFDAALAVADRADHAESRPVAAVASSAPRSGGGGGSGVQRRSFAPAGAGGPRDMSRDMSAVLCYGCHRHGHYRNRCPDGARPVP